MPTLAYRSPMPASAEALFAWHARPGAFQRLVPPWAPVALEHFEGIRDGERAVLRVGPGPGMRWVAEHRAYEAGRQFRDVQISGPFARWEHTHRMIPAGASASVLEDHIEYALPLGPLGALGVPLVRREFDAQFAYRHRTTAADLARHSALGSAEAPRRVAITGASGLLGSALSAFLTTGGHTVVRLVRSRDAARQDDAIFWDPASGQIDAAGLEGLDAVVHLAAENVFAPVWTEPKKRRIYASRIQGTRLLAKALARLDAPPRAFVSASDTGIYGDRGADVLADDAAPRPSDGFLALVARDWEAATAPAERAGIATTHARLGVVLTPAGGALAKLRPLFLAGLGGRVGPKNAYLPWIGLDDAVYALAAFALLPDAPRGAVNVVAPEAVTQAEFADTLARALHRPAVLNPSVGLLRTLGGEMVRETVLGSTRAVPARLEAAGHDFAYPTLESALKHVLGKTQHPA